MRTCTLCTKNLRINNKSGLCSAHYLEKWERDNRGVGGKKYKQKLEYNKKYYSSNIQSFADRSKKWRLENKEKAAEIDRNKILNNPELYKKLNRDYVSKRLKTDENFRLRKILRTNLYLVLKGKWTTEKALYGIGCDVDTLKKHIELNFKEGMSWDNWGEWQLDHVLPVSSFNLVDPQEWCKAANYKNIQPLWKHENYTKGSKIVYSESRTT